MTRTVESVDIVWDAGFGDSAKGKVVSHLSHFKAATSGMLRTEKKHYDFVARFAGGQNAGHTIFKDGVKYKTHIVPAGIFHGITSLIGPGCVVNLAGLKEELNYLDAAGFNTDLVRISPKAHIVTQQHIDYDKEHLAKRFGTTSKGIAPAYSDKYARTGGRFEDYLNAIDSDCDIPVIGNGQLWKDFLFDGKLYGNVLCEGAQGFYLDIDWGNYPFVTSSTTLPFGACSLGFSPKKIRNIYAVEKIYQTRSGNDPDFPDSLFDNPELALIGEVGQEIGTTTGRRRKVNYMNLDRLIFALNTAGCNKLIISKCDILEQVQIFRLFYHGERRSFVSLDTMKEFITDRVMEECPEVERIYYSYSAETVEDLTVED